MRSNTLVQLEGINGELFDLTNGTEGIYLATDVKGCFYDPPVKVVFEEPGNYPGARYLNHRILKRDITFGVEILNDDETGSNSWLSRDSEWAKAWAFDKPCKLYVTTPQSGTRYLWIQLFESMDVDMKTDPNMNEINLTVMSCVSYDPFWYEDDVVVPATTKLDTRFKPGLIAQLDRIPTETLFIDVDTGVGGLNPTNQYIAPKWTVPGSMDEIPNFDYNLFGIVGEIDIPWERAPFTRFVIPDYSFEDPTYENRRVRTPGLLKGENCVIDTDRRREQFSADNGAPVWARANGVRFRNMIPPYTEKRRFEITASGTAPGQIITIRLPRPWTRCWGLEN